MGAHAQPQASPDFAADQERRSQERARASQERERAPEAIKPQAAPAVAAWPENETPCQVVRGISLEGPDAAQFTWALDPLLAGPHTPLRRCLGVAGVQAVVQRVQARITERGFVTTRVLVPPQDLSDGQLRLTVAAGRIRQIRFAAGTSERATAWNAIPVQPGDVLDLRQIEQALDNLKRVPTADADIRIEPADAPNESDIVIDWKQALPLRVGLTLDDSGSRATGKYQASATFSYDHWWTLNDLFYITASRDAGGGQPGERGTGGHTVHYSVPWGHWLLGLTTSESRYHQSVAGASQDYIYSGTSASAEIKLSRLLWRTASGKTTASLKGWLRRSRNFVDDTEVEVQRRATGGWELSLGQRQYVGDALVDVSAAYRRGTAAFGAMPSPEEAFGEGTSRMRLWTAEASAQVPLKLLSADLRYSGTWRAQWNSTPLTPQDRFAIGGRYTVRGFDGESSLSAERGWLVRNELGWRIKDCSCEPYLGADYGSVSGPSAEFLAGRHLAGAVLGLRGSLGPLGYDIFLGRPISRPAHFRTASPVAGFSLQASF